MNVILCGMMGCGKTTVADALSSLYGYKSVDTDKLIVERYGDISKIFKEHGEEYFRDLESEVVKYVANECDGAVISLGGGCVLREENVKKLKSTGTVFYLRTRAETIIERLRGDSTRPLLAGDIEERVKTILAARAKIYENAADCILDTDDLSPEELAKIIRENCI